MRTPNSGLSEIKIYDSIAQRAQINIRKTAIDFFGKTFTECKNRKKKDYVFPHPLNLWVDCVTAADSQYEAYRYLSPIKNKTFLQFGGSGSHAVKALVGGASKAFLLSPSQGELDLGASLAKYMEVGANLVPILGTGEKIPLDAGSVDLIYGGGCLHHTIVNQSLRECLRVLKYDGKAAFVEPRYNKIYRLILSLTKGSRFCGDEDELLDAPLHYEELVEFFKSHSCNYHIYSSGGLLRYGLVASDRLLKVNFLNANIARVCLKMEKGLMEILCLNETFNNMAIMFKKRI